MGKIYNLFFLKNTTYTDVSLRPIPWVTHKAYLFLDEFIKNNINSYVLEFGCGSSTLWFAQRTKNLVSVEHSVKWFNSINKVLKTSKKYFKVNLILHSQPYFVICNNFPENYFDLILVDGRNRKGCINANSI